MLVSYDVYREELVSKNGRFGKLARLRIDKNFRSYDALQREDAGNRNHNNNYLIDAKELALRRQIESLHVED